MSELITGIFGFIIGFMICVFIISDWVPIHEVNGVKSIYSKGHVYVLNEVDIKQPSHGK
jgi:hypothetical protein